MNKAIEKHEDKYVHISKKGLGIAFFFSLSALVCWGSVFWIMGLITTLREAGLYNMPSGLSVIPVALMVIGLIFSPLFVLMANLRLGELEVR